MAPPAKTSPEKIVAAARAIIVESGVEALSLQRVAAAVGVQAPSLYKRFADRAALLTAVRDSLLDQLAVVLAEPAAGPPDVARLRAMGHAYRGFAQRLGRLYPLLFASGGAPSPSTHAALAPLMTLLDALIGRAHALQAARTFTAFLHGFVTMELNASFQMAGSVEDAFRFGLRSVIDGVIATAVAISLPPSGDAGTDGPDGPRLGFREPGP